VGAPLAIRRLGAGEAPVMRRLNAVFAAAFADAPTYLGAPPDDAYFARVLAKPDMVALVALEGASVVGGLVAYALEKLEQARCELYVYDLAVEESHRRQGVATALIERLLAIGAAMGASAIFVQADYGDEPAIALYTKLGAREDVMHFDLALAGPIPASP
jgi:aminoglycoside 3-N-acetyltransferase I